MIIDTNPKVAFFPLAFLAALGYIPIEGFILMLLLAYPLLKLGKEL